MAGEGGGEEGCTEWPHPLRGKGLVLGGKEAGLLEAGLGRHAHEMRIPLLLLGAEGGRRGRGCNTDSQHGGERGGPPFPTKMARSIFNTARPRILHFTTRLIVRSTFPSTLRPTFSREVRFYEAIFYSSFPHSLVRSFLSYSFATLLCYSNILYSLPIRISHVYPYLSCLVSLRKEPLNH